MLCKTAKQPLPQIQLRPLLLLRPKMDQYTLFGLLSHLISTHAASAAPASINPIDTMIKSTTRYAIDTQSTFLLLFSALIAT